MKEQEQNVGATAYVTPNNANPNPHAPIYYGNQSVPHPTNNAAKMVDSGKVMRAVMQGK